MTNNCALENEKINSQIENLTVNEQEDEQDEEVALLRPRRWRRRHSAERQLLENPVISTDDEGNPIPIKQILNRVFIRNDYWPANRMLKAYLEEKGFDTKLIVLRCKELGIPPRKGKWKTAAVHVLARRRFLVVTRRDAEALISMVESGELKAEEQYSPEGGVNPIPVPEKVRKVRKKKKVSKNAPKLKKRDIPANDDEDIFTMASETFEGDLESSDDFPIDDGDFPLEDDDDMPL